MGELRSFSWNTLDILAGKLDFGKGTLCSFVVDGRIGSSSVAVGAERVGARLSAAPWM